MAIKFLNTTAVETNLLYANAANSNVGIGTASPATSAKLTVMGNQTFGLPGNGSNANGRFISIEGNTDTYGEGSSRIFFAEHNSTTSAMDSYGMSLGYRGGDTSIVGASGNTWTGLTQVGNGSWGMWGHNGDATGVLVMSGDRAATYVVIPGKVGIGTTSPVSKLEVGGSIKASGITANIGTDPGVSLSYNTTTGINYINTWASSPLVTSTYNYQAFETQGVERMRILGGSGSAAGNVGIGTDTPDTLLHVKGGADDNESLLYIENTHSAGGTQFPAAMFTNTYGNHSFGTIAEFRMGNTTGTDRPSILFTNGVTTNNWSVGQGVYGANDNFAIGFRTAHPGVVSAWADPKIVILTGGNVGIGTTGPETKLDVNGIISLGGQQFAKYDSTNDLFIVGDLDAAGAELALNVDAGEAVRINATGAVKFNAYNSTNNAGTPTYLLGTDASGNIVKTLSTPGAQPQFNNTKSKAYTSLTGSSNDWFTLFQVTDSMGPVNCKMFTYAHDAVEFSVTEGYGPSNAGSITIINSVQTSNGGFATVSAVRINQNGFVEVKLVFSSGPVVNIGVVITGYNVPNLSASLVTSTQTASIVDSVGVDVTGILRSKRILQVGGTESQNSINTVFLTNTGDSWINGNSGSGLGIGTASPDAKLHVKGGDIQTTDTTGANGVLRIRSTLTGTPTFGYPNVGAGDAVIEGGGTTQRQPGVITLINDDSSIAANQDLGVIQFVGKDDNASGYTSSQIIGTSSGAPSTGNSGGGILRFLTSSGGTGVGVTEKMRIDKSGKVGIGVVPTATLDVSGSFKLQSGGSTYLSISSYYGSPFINTGTSGGTVQFGAPASNITNIQVQGTITAVRAVRMGNESAAASASNAGSTRYRVSGNNSYMDMSMRTGATSYAWVNIVQNNW